MMKDFDLEHLSISLEDPIGPWAKRVTVHVNNYSNDPEEFTLSDIEDLKATISALQEGIKFLEGEE